MRHTATFITIFFIAITTLLSAGCSSIKREGNPEGKKAILMVHFGTTYDDTRSVTIDALNKRVSEAFPQYDVFEAYTSRIIIRKLKERGIEKLTPAQALHKLSKEGYTSVIVQPSHIITGKENKALEEETGKYKNLFSHIRIGKPLLYSVEDTREVTETLAARHKHQGAGHHVLLVGHGTEDPAVALYCQADYMFKAEGHKNFHVATIEGFPSFENAARILSESGAKKVTLAPFMFVAGDHAANDISADWKKNLEELGFQVELCIEGLGQIPQIQDIYLRHIKEAEESQEEDFLERKSRLLSSDANSL